MLRPASRRARRPSEPSTSPYDPETAQLPDGPNPYQQGQYEQGQYEQGQYEQGQYEQGQYEQGEQDPYEQAPGGPGHRGPGRGWRRGARGPGGPRTRKHRIRRLLRRRSVRIILALVAVFCCWLAFSVGQALSAPNGGSTSSKLAEWARDHYLGPVVTFGEWLSYSPPKAGGKPSFSLAVPSASPVKYKHTKAFKPIIPRSAELPGRDAAAGRGPVARAGDGQGRAGHLRHLPAALVGVYLIRGRDRLDGPAAGHLPAAPWRPRPWPR